MTGRISSFILGIDAGGTFTDAVLVDSDNGHVVGAAKAPTTRASLDHGVSLAIEKLGRQIGWESLRQVRSVNLSTTLATNAIVEGSFSHTALILIGYTPNTFTLGKGDSLGASRLIHVDGGHDYYGNERKPFDEESLREKVIELRSQVEAFAVSGFYGVRNPSHEKRAREIIQELTGLPIVCGFELSSQLNSVKRATTAALNAALVPVIKDLLDSLTQSLLSFRITAPIMVVRGDGTLMSASWASVHPIETILSGPAASMMGALHLAESESATCFVVDMGGTTSDLARITDGKLDIRPEGASVGTFRTMVKAVDVRTIGLGGDSEIHLGRPGELFVGPRRVLPLCRAGMSKERMTSLLKDGDDDFKFPLFLLPGKGKLPPGHSTETRILEEVGDSGVSCEKVLQRFRDHKAVEAAIGFLQRTGCISVCGFTPTDALHVLGSLSLGDRALSLIGAERLATVFGAECAADFSKDVVSTVSRKLAEYLLIDCLSMEGVSEESLKDRLTDLLLCKLLDSDAKGSLCLRGSLSRPVLGVGAPTSAFCRVVESRLSGEVEVPPHSFVASAVGAAIGSRSLKQAVLVAPLSDKEHFRAHLPLGVKDFETLDEAISFACEKMKEHLGHNAQKVGIRDCEMQVRREDDRIVLKNGKELFFGTTLWFELNDRDFKENPDCC